MIQRIQSLWLLLAAVVTGLLFKFPVYGGVLAAGGEKQLLVGNSLLLFIVSIVLVVFPLIAIFLYKDRGNQKKMIIVSLLLNVVFVGLIWMEVDDFVKAYAFKESVYRIAVAMPILAIVLLIMAYSGIRKDEKLIQNADRLR